MKCNSTLLTVVLPNNNIGNEGLIALAETLKSNSTLQKLELVNNYIEDKGATAMAEALNCNSTLQKLGLANNFIGDEGATDLVEAFKKNWTLQDIELSDNNISETLRIQIGRLLSDKYRDKRRLEMSQSKLNIDPAQAVPRKSNSPVNRNSVTQLTAASSSSTLIDRDS